MALGEVDGIQVALREAHEGYLAALKSVLTRFELAVDAEPGSWSPRQVALHVLESEATFGRWLCEASGQRHRLRGRLVRQHTAQELVYRSAVLFEWVDGFVGALTVDDLAAVSAEYEEMLSAVYGDSEAPEATVRNLIANTMTWHLGDHAQQLVVADRRG